MMAFFSAVFESVKAMSWSAFFVIPVVLLCRILLRRAERRWSYFLWGIVALRLIFPVMLPSQFGLLSIAAQTGGQLSQTFLHTAAEIPEDRKPDLPEQMSKMDDKPGVEGNPAGAGKRKDRYLGASGKESDTLERGNSEASVGYNRLYVWLGGLALMIFYEIISVILLKRKLRFATRLSDGVFESDVVSSPFVFGLVRPAIYLPYHLNGQDREYILKHERTHIRRRDYLIKWGAYLILSVYWFHPLVWLSYVLMGRDMEISCDEQVLSGMDEAERKAYGTLLLRFAGKRQKGTISAAAFGERGIRQRIGHILHYRKKSLWSALFAAAFCGAVAMFCLTDPQDLADSKGKSAALYEEEKEPEKFSGEAAQSLYQAANPYIGDASADGKLIGEVFEYTGEARAGTMELQTDSEPYILTFHFKKEPDQTKMWENAVLLLALIGNCGKVEWDYPVRDGFMTVYVSIEDANMNLGIADIKAYGASPEKVEELLHMFEDFYGLPDNSEKIYTGGEPEELKAYLKSLPDNYEDAAGIRGILAFDQNGEAKQMDPWTAFYSKVRKKSMAKLLISNVTTEGDLVYTYISYDGNAFYCMEDDSRDAFRSADSPEYYEMEFQNLLVETVRMGDADYLTATLGNGDGLTYEDYLNDMLSSVMPVRSWHPLFRVKQEEQ